MTPAKAAPDHRPTVAIFRAPLFNPSETFIQSQAGSLARYRPVLVGFEDKGNVAPGVADAILIAQSPAERLALAFGTADRMAARLRPFAPALVHAHFGTDGLIALPLARALGVPLVTTLHGHEVSRTRGRLLRSGRLSWTRYALLGQRLMQGGDLFLAVSAAVRERAIARGFPEARTFVHHVGVDLSRLRPDDRSVEPGLILHVGRLVEKKGTATLLEAFVAVRRRYPAARLVVIGDGPLRARLQRLAVGLGLSISVRFIGALPAEEVGRWMQRAWLIAAPSVTARDGDAEGLPTVLVEAAASGLPAVATLHSGIPEIVADGRTGFLVAEHDPAALAERIIALLTSERLRADLARAGRAAAERGFDLAAQTRLLEDHYDRVRGQIRSDRSR